MTAVSGTPGKFEIDKAGLQKLLSDAGAMTGDFSFTIDDNDPYTTDFNVKLKVESLIDPVSVMVNHHTGLIEILLSPDMMDGIKPDGSLVVVAVDKLSLIHI